MRIPLTAAGLLAAFAVQHVHAEVTVTCFKLGDVPIPNAVGPCGLGLPACVATDGNDQSVACAINLTTQEHPLGQQCGQGYCQNAHTCCHNSLDRYQPFAPRCAVANANPLNYNEEIPGHPLTLGGCRRLLNGERV